MRTDAGPSQWWSSAPRVIEPEREDDEASSSAPDAARDAALVERAQRGDAHAFDALITPLLPRAMLMARRLLEHDQDAEDLVQDACLRALDRLDQHDRQRPFAPWFMRMLVNLGLNKQKTRQVRRYEPLTELEPTNTALPDEAMERTEIQERFTRAIAGLSERQRQVVLMHEVDGWSTSDIATALELSPQTVRWHLHDARHTLRLALHEFRDDGTSTISEKR